MNESTPIVLTEKELRKIIRDGVQEAFINIGINANSPESTIEMQKDMQFIREWRVSSEAVKKKGMLTIIGIVVTGLCGAVWLGVRHFFNG